MAVRFEIPKGGYLNDSFLTDRSTSGDASLETSQRSNLPTFKPSDLAPAFGACPERSRRSALDASFTTQRQDTVPGLYDFPAREYSIQGRWPSPDPAGLASVDPSNPQSWNRYAYVLNNPLKYVDSKGLYCDYYDDSGDNVEYTDWESDPNSCGNSGGSWTPDPSPSIGDFTGNPNGVTGCVTVGTNSAGCGNSNFGTGPQPDPTFNSANQGGFWSFMNSVWNLTGSYFGNVPVAGSFNIPTVPQIGFVIAVPFAYTRATQTTCVGAGAGFSTPGKGFNVGPLLLGNVPNSGNILSGQSLSLNLQTTPVNGVQYITNRSGSLGGPTIGTPGGSITYTWSACGQVK